MRILFLDDDDIRHKQFASIAFEHEVVHVRTAASAIEALDLAYLTDNTFDYGSLDHDLGGEHMASGPGHGYDVAVWCEEFPEKAPKRVVVHSYNPAGAKRMLAAFRQANIPAISMAFPTWVP
jgi:ActR/RegA family two-component response regulator